SEAPMPSLLSRASSGGAGCSGRSLDFLARWASFARATARSPPAGTADRTHARPGSVLLELLDLFDHLRDHLEQVPDDPVRGDLEDRGFGVLVDGHDDPRGRHSGEVLDGAGDAARDVE